MTRALRLSLAALVAAPLALGAQSPARAQDGGRPGRSTLVRVGTELSADTVTVGDRFRAQVSAWLSPRSWVELEPPADSQSVQLVSPPKTAMEDSASGRLRVELEMVAWRTGLPDSLDIRGRWVDADGGSRPIHTRIALPVVRSVLPPDTSKHVPRGPKDVWGPSRPWPLLAALAALLILLALAAWLLLRRRKKRRAENGRTPRERALAALEEARASGLAEAGEWKAFYTLVSDALRRYAMSVDMRWSTDLTTSELLAEMRAHRVPDGALEPLDHVLRVADLAKFARARRTPDDARRDWETARRWVETFDRSSAKPLGAEPALAGAGAEEAAR